MSTHIDKKNTTHFKCPVQKLAADQELEPFERLALSVVALAAHDLRRVRGSGESLLPIGSGTILNNDELHLFFRSRWCNVLLCTTGMSGK